MTAAAVILSILSSNVLILSSLYTKRISNPTPIEEITDLKYIAQKRLRDIFASSSVGTSFDRYIDINSDAICLWRRDIGAEIN